MPDDKLYEILMSILMLVVRQESVSRDEILTILMAHGHEELLEVAGVAEDDDNIEVTGIDGLELPEGI